MLYVHLKSGETRAVERASAGRIVGLPEGELLECVDKEGAVVARFAASEVLFYSRLPHDQIPETVAGQSPDAETGS